MELKKNPKIDLSKKRPMFLSIGLMVSLLFVTSAFQWSSIYQPMVFLDEIEGWEEPFIEIIKTSHPLPKKPKVFIQPTFKAVEDKIEVAKVEVVIYTGDPEIFDVPEFTLDIEPMVEAPTDWSEVMPEPMEGHVAFQKFLAKNIRYPNQARRMGIEGKVFIQFVVDVEGNVSQIKTLKGIGAGCDEEAERVMALLAKWKPGRQGAKRVAVRMIMPISFRLN